MSDLVNGEPQTLLLCRVREDGTPDIAEVRFRFPVPHGQMRIRQAVRIDAIEIPGRSGKVKQTTGYEDAEIDIGLVLTDDEDAGGQVTNSALAKLKEIQAAFRDRDDKALPARFTLQSPLSDACAIQTVLFKGLEVNDTEGDTWLEVTISLVELTSIAVQVEKHTRSEVAKARAAKQVQAAAKSDPITAELGTEDPLAEAYRAGKAAAMGGEP